MLPRLKGKSLTRTGEPGVFFLRWYLFSVVALIGERHWTSLFACLLYSAHPSTYSRAESRFVATANFDGMADSTPARAVYDVVAFNDQPRVHNGLYHGASSSRPAVQSGSILGLFSQENSPPCMENTKPRPPLG